jgi:hypothetical protein
MSAKCPWCDEPIVDGKKYFDCGTSTDPDATEKDRDFACLILAERNNWRNAARALHAIIPSATSWREPANVQAALELYRKAQEASQ